MFFNLQVQGVDFFLNVDGQFQARDNAAVGADVVQVQTPLAPVFEPLLAHLISADAIGLYGVAPGVFFYRNRSAGLTRQSENYHPKKAAMYLKAVKMMIPDSIHLMAFAGTNFWQRAPRYIPAMPPTPNKTPRCQSGATDIFG